MLLTNDTSIPVATNAANAKRRRVRVIHDNMSLDGANNQEDIEKVRYEEVGEYNEDL